MMPHGFLNYNVPLLGMKDEADETIRQGLAWIKDLALNDVAVLET